MEIAILLLLTILQIDINAGNNIEIPVNTGYFLRSRITNGVNAKSGEFGFMVSVQWGIPPFQNYNHSFGGVVIDKYWILTAGHCIVAMLKVGDVRLKIGIHNIREDNEFSKNLTIDKKIVHEDYDRNEMVNDIGLIKINNPLSLNHGRTFVKLPQPGAVHTGMAIIIGWGSISSNINLPDYLQKAVVRIMNNTECQNKLHGCPIQHTQFCTGSATEVISACHGDSGGPLIQYRNKTIELIGIISWGLLPCGLLGAPTIYTRVSLFIEWINTTIMNN